MMRREKRNAGAKHHAPEPLARRQAPARHRDDKRVVTRQQDVDHMILPSATRKSGAGISVWNWLN
jgi:hypothetical protein